MKKRQPVAFMSYVRFDDEHEMGRLTEFRKRLSAEVRMQTGEEFSIFQDRNDIQWGQHWKERIEESLDDVTFLIAILTPGFFMSPACRNELQQFLKREKKLKRNDLILPIYYVNCPLFSDEAKRATDKLAQVIADRQYADWREQRFEPLTSPQVGKILEQLAVQIRDALERVGNSSKIVPKRATTKARVRPAPKSSLPSPQDTESVTESGKAAPRPSAKTEPPTRVVDLMHRGDYTTITEAINAANPGDRILIRPGLYLEGLVIDKPLEIIGEGDTGDVVVQATGKYTILFKTTMGRMVNLTLRQIGGGDWFGVDITQGRLELEGCDITSQGLSCVAIHDGADPRLRRNRIHDGKQGGVFVNENGLGTLEDNDIFGNTFSGVEIATGGNPTLRRNRINKNGFVAVRVREVGSGIIEDNDLRGNAKGAWSVSDDSLPKLKRARNQEDTP